MDRGSNSDAGSSGVPIELPVLASPNELEFYQDDRLLQTLKIFNPYNFSLKFNLLCTSPRKYIVNCPTGVIKPFCVVDITIQHCQISAENFNRSDRFRIQAKAVDAPSLTGYKDVPSTLYPTKIVKTDEPSAQFESMLQKPTSSEPTQYRINESTQSERPQTTALPPWVYLLGAIVCFILIGLPSEGEQSQLPSYLRFNSKAKLLAAYILGLLTTTIFR